MKYLVTDKYGMEEVILFPCWWQHADMANDMRWGADDIISAGCLKRNDAGTLYCFGESVPLKKKSRPEEDLELILRHFSFSM